MQGLPRPAGPDFEAFLHQEGLRDQRHEYLGGQVHAMAGASKRHHRLVRRLVRRLTDHFGPAGCEVFSESVLLRLNWNGDDYAYYPDVMLVCEPDDADERYVEKPCLIIEVLSESTARIDRHEKLGAYRSIPGLQTYLLLNPAPPGAVLYRRDADWRPQTFTLPQESLTLACAGLPPLQLTLADLYEGLT